jgi:hypothetical protein
VAESVEAAELSLRVRRAAATGRDSGERHTDDGNVTCVTDVVLIVAMRTT